MNICSVVILLWVITEIEKHLLREVRAFLEEGCPQKSNVKWLCLARIKTAVLCFRLRLLYVVYVPADLFIVLALATMSSVTGLRLLSQSMLNVSCQK